MFGDADPGASGDRAQVSDVDAGASDEEPEAQEDPAADPEGEEFPVGGRLETASEPSRTQRRSAVPPAAAERLAATWSSDPPRRPPRA